MTPENLQIPDWARQERQADLAWIAENLDTFWTAATRAFQDVGVGAIVVDTTSQPIPDAGHPFGYFSQEQIEQQANEDTRRMVSEYDPEHEFVVVLLKADERISTYRVRALGTEQTDWDFWYLKDREAAIAEATEVEMQLLFTGAEQLEEEGAPDVAQQLRDDAERIRQRLARQEKTANPQLEPPDIETLMQWEAEGGCEAACPHGCWVEPDGVCTHGNPSWLVKLGFI
jgi:hypothetical protein